MSDKSDTYLLEETEVMTTDSIDVQPIEEK